MVVACALVAGVPAPATARTRAQLECSGAFPIECGIVIADDNTGEPNNVETYSCMPGWTESGGEVVHEFVLSPGDWGRLAVRKSSACNHDVFILRSCDEDDCLASGDTQASVNDPEPGIYYIVVDGRDGDECPYELSVVCEPAGAPPCGPDDYHCAVVDYNPGPGGLVTEPCEGEELCWEWGPDGTVPDIGCAGVPATNVWGTALDSSYPNLAGHRGIIGPFSLNEHDCRCMELCHFYATEPYYDGGNVKISTDSGQTWNLIFPARGYDETFAYFPTPCVGGQPVFCGTSGVFVTDFFDLSPYVGMDVLIAFDFGSDSYVTYTGWYINWLVIGGDQSPVRETSWGMIKVMYR